MFVDHLLLGSPNETQLGERINYNEHFSWEWNQGRLGFGPFGNYLDLLILSEFVIDSLVTRII